ncbi:hypothetical protein FHX49_000661 [Microbacterium endophyticum]|uniref:WXG100 family type VII secretion target n=1 Tax=Microbacterium endophyticum TaxID=1526412 RepID=A0A7W4V1I4_9MICO|nr:hypothetical protein [Microbacterium endophyticum]MBB2975120.1 hypothetical protein [Microbacterium endophyticum]NIK37340.1 hypothetical protein [Microbacterium endophyticum]
MAGRLVVDTQQLETLGVQLSRVREKLADTRAELDSRETSVGSPNVVGALRGFEDHWGRGRRDLTESADALSQMLVDSATSYLNVDTDLSDGITSETVAPGAPGAKAQPQA